MSDRKSASAMRSSGPQQPQPARHSVFGKLFFKESFCAWIFIAPALTGFIVFYLLPCIRALYISLTDWNLLRAAKFIGPANYSRLWNDPNFWNAMRVTVLYVIYNIPIQTVIGLLLAVLLSQLRRSVAIRSIILAPYLIANVIAAIIWYWPRKGAGNQPPAASFRWNLSVHPVSEQS